MTERIFFGGQPRKIIQVSGALALSRTQTESENDADWRARALCGQTDPEAFFPERGAATKQAKRVCMSCEVRPACLEWALPQPDLKGYWGGASEKERREIRKSRSENTEKAL
jgi:WhiB family redox-sensing transcriptional regulator